MTSPSDEKDHLQQDNSVVINLKSTIKYSVVVMMVIKLAERGSGGGSQQRSLHQGPNTVLEGKLVVHKVSK